jgi:hypothetical protein
MSLAEVPSRLLHKSGNSTIQDVMKCADRGVLCHKNGRFMLRKEVLVQKKNNMSKSIRLRYNANFRITVFKYAEQTTVKHNSVSEANKQRWKQEKEKLKNVNSMCQLLFIWTE